jgi:translation initiation factor 2B subunit (eIF-2B alpha/beta/delta family)
MKKLIKEIAKREGKKSQTSIANIRETLKILAEILLDPSGGEKSDEFLTYLEKTAEKLWKYKPREVTLKCRVGYDFKLKDAVINYNKYIEKKYGKQREVKK